MTRQISIGETDPCKSKRFLLEARAPRLGQFSRSLQSSAELPVCIGNTCIENGSECRTHKGGEVNIDSVLAIAPVVPVLVLADASPARRVAEAFFSGGLPVLEVTLRTPAALEVISEMSRVPGVVVGAGTVLCERDLDAAINAGAKFAVSPGLTESLARAAAQRGVPLLPGVATATDIMRGLELGYARFKFFPAEAAGGLATLRALGGPFGGVRFCPTGGITPATAVTWLAEPSVACVGGSWLFSEHSIDFTAIETGARLAAGLRRAAP
jgi:2-dehydro-3-deoxyphosphogluconate aldolase/(4S)-4-hydroxy-2-oxoglutarate aldolase